MLPRLLRWFSCLFALLWLAASGSLSAQQSLPVPEASDHWRMAGLPAIRVMPSFSVNVREFGAVGDGVTDDSVAFAAAFAALPPEGGIIDVPAGVYLITHPLRFVNPNTHLRGEGSSTSRLLCALQTAASCISASGREAGAWLPLAGGYERASTTLTVEQAGVLQTGDYIEIQAAASPPLRQISRIAAVDGAHLTIADPLLHDFASEDGPQVRKLSMMAHVGIADLYMYVRAETGGAQTITFRRCAFCYLWAVELDHAVHTHVRLAATYRSEIHSATFYNTQRNDPDAGGVQITDGAVGTRLTDSIFFDVPRALTVQHGAATSVAAYNFAYHDEATPPAPAAFVITGQMTTDTLVEGNVVNAIDIAPGGGSTVRGTVIFRNRLTRPAGDWSVRVGQHTSNTAILGNRFDHVGVMQGETANGVLLHGNALRVNPVQWDAALGTAALPASLYLTTQPGFLRALDFPPVQADSPLSTNAAVERYLQRFHPIRSRGGLPAGS